jgi:hypothetical protein
VWNGRWWVHTRFCSAHCEDHYQLERCDANARHRWYTLPLSEQLAELTTEAAHQGKRRRVYHPHPSPRCTVILRRNRRYWIVYPKRQLKTPFRWRRCHGGAPVSWARFLMVNRRSTSPPRGCATSPARRGREKLRGLRLSRAAELVEAAVEETLAYYAFPEEHWRRIRTNNPLERILRSGGAPVSWARFLAVNRRSAHLAGRPARPRRSAVPDGSIRALNLAAARLRHIAGTAWRARQCGRTLPA